MDEVESIFIKHFANNDSKKAMKFLRPQQNKASHMVTFLVGNASFSQVLTCPWKLVMYICEYLTKSKECPLSLSHYFPTVLTKVKTLCVMLNDCSILKTVMHYLMWLTNEPTLEPNIIFIHCNQPVATKCGGPIKLNYGLNFIFF